MGQVWFMRGAFDCPARELQVIANLVTRVLRVGRGNGEETEVLSDSAIEVLVAEDGCRFCSLRRTHDQPSAALGTRKILRLVA